MSPNLTSPSISEIVAGSFGRRASNNSATRGRPPVMSRLVSLTRNLGDDRTGADFLAVFNSQLCANRNHEVSQALLLAALDLNDLDVRVQLLFLVFDDNGLAETGELVELLGHRLTGNEVDEAQSSVDVRDDRIRVRIPGEDDMILLHFVAVLHHQRRSERYLEARANGAAAIAAALDGELTFVRGDDLMPLGVGDDHQPVAK